MWHTHFLKYFFQNLFYIYKLEHVSSAFVERHLSFIICLGQKSVGSCPRSNFLGVVVQGVIFRKNCPCSKSSGGQLPWENFMGDNYTGANWEVFFWEAKLQEVIMNFNRGNCPVGKSLEGNYHGGNITMVNCPGVICPGGMSRYHFHILKKTLEVFVTVV